LALVPNACARNDELLFSESASRYLIGTRDPEKLRELLSRQSVPFAEIGHAEGSHFELLIKTAKVRASVSQIERAYYSLAKSMR
jgi:phosphoribosylformylglycinamidine (FGAM) synthase-like enzyme